MRRIAYVLGLLTLLYLPAKAQTINAEVFGGYSYLRLDTGGGTHSNFNGWNASLNVKPSKWAGIVGDFGGQYASPFGPTTSFYTYLFGPQLSLPAPVSPFVHALFGGARIGTSGISTNAFATAVGGGVDVKAAPFLSYRLIQAEYLLTRFGDTSQHNARISTGIVLRF
jgi:hypothetical protein